jgi:methionyl-tRNA formyltransferase
VWKSRVEKLDVEHEPGQIIRADKTGIYVATGEQVLVLEHIQLPGKKAMPVADVLNARADWFAIGSLLG